MLFLYLKALFIVISPPLSCDSCGNEMLWKSSNTTQKDRKASSWMTLWK